jgi:hypothetical protein
MSFCLEVFKHELRIPAIGFEVDIEGIAQDRYGANQGIHTNIDDHPCKDRVWHSETPCLVHDSQTDGSPNNVARARYETESRIRPETYVGSRDRECGIHQPRNRLQPMDSPLTVTMHVGQITLLFPGQQRIDFGCRSRAGNTAMMQGPRDWLGNPGPAACQPRSMEFLS